MLDEGSAMVQAADGYIDISAGLVDTVRQELAVRGANELQILRGTADSGQIHPRLPRPMVHDLRIGRPTVKPCCPHGPVGVLSDDTTLTDILNAPRCASCAAACWRGDLDGDGQLPDPAADRPRVARRKLRVQLARAAHEPVKP